MAKGICGKCGVNPTAPAGRWCRGCFNERARETRPRYSDLTPEERRKSICRAYTNVMLQRGVMVRGVCEVCGAAEVTARHDDYDRPRVVRWLCRQHRKGEGEGEVVVASRGMTLTALVLKWGKR